MQLRTLTSGENKTPYTFDVWPPSGTPSLVVTYLLSPDDVSASECVAKEPNSEPATEPCTPTHAFAVAVAKTRSSNGSNATPHTGEWCWMLAIISPLKRRMCALPSKEAHANTPGLVGWDTTLCTHPVLGGAMFITGLKPGGAHHGAVAGHRASVQRPLA